MKSFASHVNVYQKASTMKGSLNNQADKVTPPEKLASLCHRPHQDLQNGHVNGVGMVAGAEALYGLNSREPHLPRPV